MKYYCSHCGYVGGTGPFHNMPHVPMRCLSRASQMTDEEIDRDIARGPYPEIDEDESN